MDTLNLEIYDQIGFKIFHYKRQLAEREENNITLETLIQNVEDEERSARSELSSLKSSLEKHRESINSLVTAKNSLESSINTSKVQLQNQEESTATWKERNNGIKKDIDMTMRKYNALILNPEANGIMGIGHKSEIEELVTLRKQKKMLESEINFLTDEMPARVLIENWKLWKELVVEFSELCVAANNIKRNKDIASQVGINLVKHNSFTVRTIKEVLIKNKNSENFTNEFTQNGQPARSLPVCQKSSAIPNRSFKFNFPKLQLTKSFSRFGKNSTDEIPSKYSDNCSIEFAKNKEESLSTQSQNLKEAKDHRDKQPGINYALSLPVSKPSISYNLSNLCPNNDQELIGYDDKQSNIDTSKSFGPKRVDMAMTNNKTVQPALLDINKPDDFEETISSASHQNLPTLSEPVIQSDDMIINECHENPNSGMLFKNTNVATIGNKILTSEYFQTSKEVPILEEQSTKYTNALLKPNTKDVIPNESNIHQAKYINNGILTQETNSISGSTLNQAQIMYSPHIWNLQKTENKGTKQITNKNDIISFNANSEKDSVQNMAFNGDINRNGNPPSLFDETTSSNNSFAIEFDTAPNPMNVCTRENTNEEHTIFDLVGHPSTPKAPSKNDVIPDTPNFSLFDNTQSDNEADDSTVFNFMDSLSIPKVGGSGFLSIFDSSPKIASPDKDVVGPSFKLF